MRSECSRLSVRRHSWCCCGRTGRPSSSPNFWAEHSILASILSTILLVGIVFLLFEEGEQREQDRLDGGLTGAGLGGIVDHLVDVEVALALISRKGPPRETGWDEWGADARPFDGCGMDANGFSVTGDGGPSDTDPRKAAVALPSSGEGDEWRMNLVDQCVRRLLVALRDWSPLVGVSKNGVFAMLAISELRKDLMKLEGEIRDGRAHSMRASGSLAFGNALGSWRTFSRTAAALSLTAQRSLLA